MTTWLIGVVVVFAAGEVILWGLHHLFRPHFQWLIGHADEAPAIDNVLVEKHIAGGFDPDLGWVRKPGTKGTDQTADGPKCFTVDARGRRADSGNVDLAPGVAVFGDSYVFCRLVDDDETWPHYLSWKLGRYVTNYGVGNYGLDQALLRYEREVENLEERVIALAVVPETMARIHSYWKHYFEYGNLLAFKPRFTMDAKGLVLHPPAVRTSAGYRSYRDKIDEIRVLDPFYETKFRPDMLSFPRLVRVLARAHWHVPILWHLSVGAVSGARERGCRRAFDTVVRCNAEHTAAMYRDPAARGLFRALVERFRDRCRADDLAPLLVIIPQPIDLERQQRGRDDYRDFISELGTMLPVIDMTEAFLGVDNWRQLYVDGPLGPHVGPEGNRMIADAVAEPVSGLITERRQATA